MRIAINAQYRVHLGVTMFVLQKLPAALHQYPHG